MSQTIEFTPLSKIFLDPKNPRLGRSAQENRLTQEQIYDCMRDWSLEELATSFLESGFWVHEAVLCVVEEIDGCEQLVVIEGNRRIAALKRLKRTYEGEESSLKWLELIRDVNEPAEMFAKVPFIRVAERSDVDAFLGFRHVTGVKEWKPTEKAAFIVKLINEHNLSYRDVMRKIGSKTPVVERNYITHCLFVQMMEVESLDISTIERRFSVLFLALRSSNVQRFLGIENKFGIQPSEVPPPVDKDHLERLKEFSIWLFGDEETFPIVEDSRQVDKFARVLASGESLNYLRTIRRPNLEKAYIIAGGNQEELYDTISNAAINLQDALSVIHRYKDDENLIKVVIRLIENAEQIKKMLDID